MNKERRKQLREAIAKLDEARIIIETVRDEEQGAFDNMPESLQDAERGQKMDEAIGSMTDVADDLESAIENLNEVCE